MSRDSFTRYHWVRITTIPDFHVIWTRTWYSLLPHLFIVYRLCSLAHWEVLPFWLHAYTLISDVFFFFASFWYFCIVYWLTAFAQSSCTDDRVFISSCVPLYVYSKINSELGSYLSQSMHSFNNSNPKQTDSGNCSFVGRSQFIY